MHVYSFPVKHVQAEATATAAAGAMAADVTRDSVTFPESPSGATVLVPKTGATVSVVMGSFFGSGGESLAFFFFFSKPVGRVRIRFV
jgi:hypothetical protein